VPALFHESNKPDATFIGDPPGPGEVEVDALLELLDECERRLAVAVAVSNGCLDAAQLAGVLGQSTERISAALQVLAGLDWIRAGPTGQPTIRHALIASRLRELCPPECMRNLQAAVTRIAFPLIT
jgi:hypothetical protein